MARVEDTPVVEQETDFAGRIGSFLSTENDKNDDDEEEYDDDDDDDDDDEEEEKSFLREGL